MRSATWQNQPVFAFMQRTRSKSGWHDQCSVPSQTAHHSRNAVGAKKPSCTKTTTRRKSCSLMTRPVKTVMINEAQDLLNTVTDLKVPPEGFDLEEASPVPRIRMRTEVWSPPHLEWTQANYPKHGDRDKQRRIEL